MRLSEVGTPVAAADGKNRQFGDDDSSANGSSDFLGGLDTETNVTVAVTNDDDSLETGTLTGTSLLLDGLNLLMGMSRQSPYFVVTIRPVSGLPPYAQIAPLPSFLSPFPSQ